MGQIQTSVGLVTGFPIEDTVTSLMEIAAQPIELLQERTDDLEAEQVALTDLSAMLLTVNYIAENLAKEEIYEKKSVSSSNENALSATIDGSPTEGTYQFTPVQTAQQHQLLSDGVRSETEALGGGEVTLRFGDNVERDMTLEFVNGGEGIVRGSIRITDRSGASAEIDLSTAYSIDDVLDAINESQAINVTAVASGDGLKLIDETGQSTSNLMVQEINGGTTAASLGLADINTASDTATGDDIVSLSRDTDLSILNDGNGVQTSTVLPDIQYQLSDGTEGTIDLSPIADGSSDVLHEYTLGEILDAINAAEPDKLYAEISEDGDRLIVTDLTSGAETFSLTSMSDSMALEDLGLDVEAVGGVVTGNRILGGLKTVLLSSLNGGRGLGTLGSIDLTDREGNTETVSLADADTLQDVVEAINSLSLGIEASINDAKTGILLTDTTGSTVSDMIVADSDATNTATALGLAGSVEATTIDSGDLHLQVVSLETALSDLNGGDGITTGKVTIIDSNGVQDVLKVTSSMETLGDLVRAINGLEADVEAEINASGDGIWLVDKAGGTGTLQVAENGSTTAADLRLTGDVVEETVDGELTQVIDGSMSYTITLDEEDTLEDLRDKINDLDADFEASLFDDGSSEPYRLSLVSSRSGTDGQLVVDMSALGLEFNEIVEAQDALLVFGSLDAADSNVLIASSSNTIEGAIEGIDLEINGTTDSPVTITVESSNSDVVASLETFVENYNSFRELLEEYTEYDADTETKSVLTGDSSALRLDVDLSYFLSSQFLGVGSIQSLMDLGISIEDDGSLSFDSDEFEDKYEEDPDAVREFFTTEETGFSAKYKILADSLTDEDSSLLTNRIETLETKIADNEERIEWMTERLEVETEALYLKFYQMETAVSQLQTNAAALDSITDWSWSTSDDDDE